ncbi:MAG: HPr family phosphocarrier protein [Candidatus Omnitrophota bacterium]
MAQNYVIQNRISARVFLINLCSTNPEFFFLAGYFLKTKEKTGRYFLNYLRWESHELETILDSAEAFTNELFFFRELLAGIRWFCRAAFTLEEGVIDRYDTRQLKESREGKNRLLPEAEKVLTYFYQVIHRLCAEALGVMEKYEVPQPEKATANPYIKLQGQTRLEKNRSVTETDTETTSVELLTTEFISVVESLVLFQENIVQKKTVINEREIGQTLSGFHTLESFYDSHIHGTLLEKNEPDFWSLRGHIAMGLRLCEITKDLTHFYERHLLTTKDPVIRRKLADLIDEKYLLSAIIDFALKHLVRYGKSGIDLALDLLTKSTGKIRRTIKIPVGVDGIHARPMTWIYKICQRYGAVIFEVGGEKFKADSMLSMLTMTEAIDRVIGLSDKESQIAVSAGTVINELETREKPLAVKGKNYTPETIISVLETFRAEIRKKSGTRFCNIIATGPKEAVDDIELLAQKFFRQEELPENLSFLFE